MPSSHTTCLHDAPGWFTGKQGGRPMQWVWGLSPRGLATISRRWSKMLHKCAHNIMTRHKLDLTERKQDTHVHWDIIICQEGSLCQPKVQTADQPPWSVPCIQHQSLPSLKSSAVWTAGSTRLQITGSQPLHKIDQLNCTCTWHTTLWLSKSNWSITFYNLHCVLYCK